MNILKFVCLGLAAMSLGACASVTKGTSHTMAVNSNPQGADCTLSRAGITIARVNPTPGQVTVDKSKDDIVVDCTLEGHKPAKHVAASEAEIMTAGNLVFGGLVGLAIDAGSGAINKYPSNVLVVMQTDPDYVPSPARAPGIAAARDPSPVPAPLPAAVAADSGSAESGRPLKQAKVGGRTGDPNAPKASASRVPSPENMTAAERMELQAGPGYRNYPRLTSGYF